MRKVSGSDRRGSADLTQHRLNSITVTAIVPGVVDGWHRDGVAANEQLQNGSRSGEENARSEPLWPSAEWQQRSIRQRWLFFLASGDADYIVAQSY